MRLTKYINEITKPTIKSAVMIVRNHLGEIGRVLEKNGWQISDSGLMKMLNGVFKRDNLEFAFEKKGAPAVERYITSAFTFDDPRVPILIKVKTGAGSYFRRFAKPGKRDNFFDINKNEFFKQLTTLLAHELIHVTQGIVSKGKSFEDDDGVSIDDDYEGYLSDPSEIDAYAQGAAVELLNRGKSNIMNQYQAFFKSDHPTYKKFLKKLYKYIRAI